MASLDGLEILMLEIGAAAPFCSPMFADMGASVIKIKPPEGDTNTKR